MRLVTVSTHAKQSQTIIPQNKTNLLTHETCHVKGARAKNFQLYLSEILKSICQAIYKNELFLQYNKELKNFFNTLTLSHVI